MIKITEIFALTGEVIERDPTKAEEEQRKKDEENRKARETAEQAEAQLKASTKAVLLNKLGITAEEAKLLLS